MDRLSTGSKESNMSTQSDWIGGEKKKKSGLIGKCLLLIGSTIVYSVAFPSHFTGIRHIRNITCVSNDII